LFDLRAAGNKQPGNFPWFFFVPAQKIYIIQEIRSISVNALSLIEGFIKDIF